MNILTKNSLTLILFICLIFNIYSQEVDQLSVQPEWEEIIGSHVMLAISTADYPVTTGDIYTLSFYTGGEQIINQILVESDQTLNLNMFGEIDATNMTFTELKPLIEEKVAAAYSRSMPSLTIESVGMFRVLIKGEVPSSQYVTAWGLLHLSEVVQGILYQYSSRREVSIVSKDGTQKTYDIFKALVMGETDQDPYIKPGDTVIVHRLDREVEVRGEVFRPGIYQLINEEGIQDLLYSYVGDFTNQADLSRVKIERMAEENSLTFFIDLEIDIQNAIELMDGDIITIPSKTHNASLVFIEGALQTEPELVEEEIYNRISHSIINGETVSGVINDVLDMISPTADLANSYIIREGEPEPIPVNLANIIYNYDESEDIFLKPFDRIQIPGKVLFVSVMGAVNNPGLYPYLPGKEFSYYLDQAGGIDIERNHNEEISITNEQGENKESDAIVLSGDNIYVYSNSFTYNFNRYFPIISTSFALVITIITIVNLLQN